MQWNILLLACLVNKIERPSNWSLLLTFMASKECKYVLALYIVFKMVMVYLAFEFCRVLWYGFSYNGSWFCEKWPMCFLPSAQTSSLQWYVKVFSTNICNFTIR